jgi:hypothetical protein
LYSWEVLPGLYPPLDRPRAPRWRIAPAVAIALLVVAIASAVLGGALIMYGVAAGAPGTYTVSGVAEKSNGGSAAFAQVVLTENGGATFSQLATSSGHFSFSGVPAGGVSINVTFSGYAPAVLYTFVDPVYNAGSQGLIVTLYPTSEANVTQEALTTFPTLESFLSSVDGAAGLLWIAAIVAVGSAWALRRQSLRSAGIIGGGAGVAVPAVVYLLGLFPAFPLVDAGTAVAAGFGMFALGISAVELYRAGTPAAGS